MLNSIVKIPEVKNEPILNYKAGSNEKLELKQTLLDLKSQVKEICMTINGEQIKSELTKDIFSPHERAHRLGYFYKGNASHVSKAIDAALQAKESWEATSWQERAAIFMRAADLISGKYRARTNGMTMLGQSKNIYQSEIDAVCEFCDFLRFNVRFMTEIYSQQPESSPTIWNKLEYRPLEGFIFALTPFNFTSIAGNLPCAPALMGNVVVWKPAETQIYSASLIMEILIEAGLPNGVINLVFVDGSTAGEVIFNHRYFAGIHFTGSTQVFKSIWQKVAQNLDLYQSFPRLVGETGGKDFIIAHESADPIQVSVALLRGAFEFQGQKCSAASRAYLPKSLWPAIQESFLKNLSKLKMGNPEDFTNFINAVIDEKSFDKITKYISDAKLNSNVKIIAGGNFDKTIGYFIEPTVILTDDPSYISMCEEIFGPVLTIYVYDEEYYKEILNLVDQSTPYALTGALFATDRSVIEQTSFILRNAAGNYYVNDKPTGAVVGQQPFGGARASGTNDKAGSHLNLLRWVSPRTIKENFVPPVSYEYPFMEEC
ncbi:MAG: L-glutamate gamma-semialdehyde dehydrogenase [Saprospiraceae bacterium]|nr:L-glutamate gamma-semialdehyde dehydrogenase [Saprospiraceae bacterium]MBK9721522.1 L-glutamate gamma-semialdehyde dehydrogenase [Saprospiraceae bacterium]